MRTPYTRAPNAIGQAALAAALLLAGVAGCRIEQRPAHDTASATPALAARPPGALLDANAEVAVHAVQLGAFSDSTSAKRLRDSLATAGWSAYVVPPNGPTASPAFRVRVAPSRDSVLTRLIAFGLTARGRPAVAVKDLVRAGTVAPQTVMTVSNGSHGMAASARWALSSDKRSLLVVEDPTAVEAEPVPDGFVFASEDLGVAVQRDGVWDVAPSPDWRKLAAGLAFVLQGRERDKIPASEWATLARQTGLSADSLRKGAFTSSGMSLAYGFAQPAVYDFAVAPDSTGVYHPIVLPMAGGWRVGWSSAGDALLVGANPARAGDDESSPSFVAVDLRGRPIPGETPSPAMVPWTMGPTLDVSVPVDFNEQHTIAAGARTIESGSGWVRVRERSEPRGVTHVVGPGTALVATASGRFVAALVPNDSGKPGDHPARLVVYDLGQGRE